MKKIIVIGAGASGMLAAGTAAEKGAEVILIEKMKREGFVVNEELRLKRKDGAEPSFL